MTDQAKSTMLSGLVRTKEIGNMSTYQVLRSKVIWGLN